MAKQVPSYRDSRGRSHATPQAATVSDIAALFKTLPAGAAENMAGIVFHNREELERIFAEHDEICVPVTPLYRIERKV